MYLLLYRLYGKRATLFRVCQDLVVFDTHDVMEQKVVNSLFCGSGKKVWYVPVYLGNEILKIRFIPLKAPV